MDTIDAISPCGKDKQGRFEIKSQLLNLSGLSIYFTASYGFKSLVYLQGRAGDELMMNPL